MVWSWGCRISLFLLTSSLSVCDAPVFPSLVSEEPPVTPTVPPAGHQVIEEQRRRLAELKQKAAAEAQCQWDALHGAAPFPAGPSGFPALMHHSILHHLPAGRERGEEGEHAYDTLSLESSDSMETSISTGGNSACSPDTMSRCFPPSALCFCLILLSPPDTLSPPLPFLAPVVWTWARSRKWRRC